MLLFLIINVFIFIKDLLILWKLLTPAEKDNKPILLKKHVNISIQKSYEYTGFIPEVFSFPSCTAVNSDTTSVQTICKIWTLFRTLYTKMQWVSQRVPTFADLDPTFSNHFFDSFQCHLKLTKGNLNYSAAYLVWRPKLLLVLRFFFTGLFPTSTYLNERNWIFSWPYHDIIKIMIEYNLIKHLLSYLQVGNFSLKTVTAAVTSFHLDL